MLNIANYLRLEFSAKTRIVLNNDLSIIFTGTFFMQQT